jgi:NAD(P)H-flavin reductase
MVLATVQRMDALSPRVRAVELSIPADWSWRAGQHVAVSGAALSGPTDPGPTDPAPAGAGPAVVGARYYSLASVPNERGTLELCVGDSDDAPAFTPGGQVWLSTPEGQPAVPSPLASLVLIGVGTGVAPLRAVVREQEQLVQPPRITLLIGFRTERDVLYGSEFEQRARDGTLDYRPVLSQPGPSWTGRSGWVQAHLDQLPRAERYCVCGKLGMVEEVRGALLAAGVTPQCLFAEGY